MASLRDAIRRKRWVYGSLAVATAAIIFAVLALADSSREGNTGARARASRHLPRAAPAGTSPTVEASHHAARFDTVGVRILELFDSARHRHLTTVVLYPAEATHRVVSLLDAHARAGPYPLIVFAHGFAVTPEPYRPLLDRWVNAGYVVAAPIFPLENANAPGGPNERDLPNQPADINYVLERMQQLSTESDPFSGLLTARAAVAGQSDGGDSALAAAYDPAQHVLPVGAAVILSGAEDPFSNRFTPQAGTPLFAVQGTADTINRPVETMAFFDAASPPKYLLLLDGAEHQEPYTVPGEQLDAVARASVAFLDAYLKQKPGPLDALVAGGDAGSRTELIAHPARSGRSL